MVTDLATAYNVDGGALAADFGALKGSGLLTLRNDVAQEMSLANYTAMSGALKGSAGKMIGIVVENLNITGTEGATLDQSGGTNVENVSLADVVASVSDPPWRLTARAPTSRAWRWPRRAQPSPWATAQLQC